jgi:uncharacterized membrane protein YfcA
MDNLLLFIIVAVCGVFIGTLSGMFGIGGGTMIIPLLRLAFGLPVTSCTATSLFTMIPTSVSGAFSHIRNRDASLQIGLAAGLGGFVFSPLGVLVGQDLDPRLIITGVALVIIYSAWNMLAPRDEQAAAATESGSAAPTADSAATAAGTVTEEAVSEHAAPAAQSRLSPAATGRFVLLGAIAGVLAGILGVGGGFLIVPVLSRLFRYPMKIAGPASLIAISLIALPTTAYNIYLGNVYYLQGLALICGTVPGARIGAALNTRLPDKQLRRGFAILLACSGVALLLNELMG